MKSEKRVLLLLAASAAVIILVTVLTLFSGKDKSAGTKRPTVKPTGAAPTGVITAEHNKLMMVKAVDTEAGTITLYDLEEGGEVTLSYGVAADIRTKYGSLTYAASLEYGDIVRAEYGTELELVRMRESSEHWELHGVDEFSVTETMLSTNGTNYKFTDTTVAYCEGVKIALGEVKSLDRVNLWGVGSEILGIEVTKGHGSIKLVNCDGFEGAEVTFGDESHTLNGETSYLVREGKYTVSVKGDTNAAAAQVTVARNEQVVIDLYEYGGAPVETAEVRFKISPFSAVLRIDGEVTEYYEQDLVLAYGEHEIEAELGGYTTYKGILNISKPYQTIQINLSERPAGESGDTGTDGDGSGAEDGNGADGAGEDSGNGDTGGDGSGAEDGNGADGAGEDSGNEGANGADGSGDGGNEDGSGEDTQTGNDSGNDTPGGETTDRRFVPIGAAGGYEYDEDCSTFILVPEGAVVLIDGISLGAAPVEFEKILGTYTVTLRKDGNEKEYTVTVEDDGEDVYWKFPMN